MQRMSAHPPGPRNWPPGKNIRAMQKDPLAFLTATAREYGDVAHFKLGPQSIFLVSSPDLIRDVLVTHDRSFMKGRALQRAKMLMGDGLLTSEGDLHRRQRRLMAPSFHRERIGHYAKVMVDNAERTTATWSDGQTVDIAKEMMHLTLSIVAETLFGTNVTAQADEIGRAITLAMESFDLIPNPLPAWMQPKLRSLEKAVKELDATMYGIIEQRRGGADRGDLLSMLLLAQDEEGSGGMSNVQVRDEAMTLFLAGHETTANALSWTWYLLAQHPDVEKKMYEEVSGPPSAGLYPYTHAVFSESMRLYPPAWLIGRLALEDVTIGGHLIRKGEVVIVSQWVMHHDPRYWPDAGRFDPSRFINAPERPKFAYFPFGGGSRICIGEGFAWAEGVMVLATIAREWRLALAQETPVRTQPMITLRPRGGIRMRLERRDRG